MKPHLLKLVTDTICYSSLLNLKEEIIDCIEEIKLHICHCTMCKRKYKFNNLTSHKCNEINEFIDVSKKIGKIKGSKKAKSSKGSKKVKLSKRVTSCAKSSNKKIINM